MITQLINH